MDEFFRWDFADNLIFFHGMLQSHQQVQLLILREFIGCPFEDQKLEHGNCLKIIGFWVDANCGSISLTHDSITNVISCVNDFLNHPDHCLILRDWQRLGGHLNWLLNVLCWGHPALSEMYWKMGGKNFSGRGIFINHEVREELTWLTDVIPQSIGVRFVDSMHWTDDAVDMVLWTDASLKLALSFCYAGNGFVYQLCPCPSHITIDIFFLELVTILSGIRHVASFNHPPCCLLVWTDSLDAVGVLNTLSTSTALHNVPLRAISEVILTSGLNLWVLHIPGKDNICANLLSCLLFDEYQQKYPSDCICTFTPPRKLLPARWRECF